MFNYCVYAYLNDEITTHLATVMNIVQERFSEALAYRVTETPHITVCYGPAIENASEEIKEFDKTAIHNLLGFNILDKYSNGGTAEYKGVSVFDNQVSKGFSVIKVEYECDVLNILRDDLYATEMMAARRAKEHADREQSGVKDETFAPVAKRWAHVTLAVVKDPTKIDEIVTFATSLIQTPIKTSISKVALISAVNDIPIPLFS